MRPRPLFVAAFLVLVIVGVMAWPAIRRGTESARRERALRDEEAITRALIRFYEDNGFFPLWDRTKSATGPRLVRIDLLVGAGTAPAAPPGSVWGTGSVGTLADELISNAPSYAVHGGPDEPGWNGPYLPDAPDPDPWRHRYVVNLGLISADDGSSDTTKYAVWVLSAGPNGIIDTPYKQPLASAALAGDDVGVRVQ